MWVAHFAPALMAKPLIPDVPLWFLALGSSLPDAVHFVLNFLRIESFNFDPKLASRGCFPYSNHYPFTHSFLGMAAIGISYVAAYSYLAKRKLTFREQLVSFAVVLSHFLLEIPAHRSDIKITPHDNVALGEGLFDRPLLNFLVEVGILLAGFLVFTAATPARGQAGAQRDPRRPLGLFLFLVLAQAHFCFGSAPTTNSQYVHAPIFLGEILLMSSLLGTLD